MIVCPSCRSEQMNGTLFCSECGSDLQNPASSTWGLEEDVRGSGTGAVGMHTSAFPDTYRSSYPDNVPEPLYSPIPSKPRAVSRSRTTGPIRADLKLVVLNTGRRVDCPDRANIIIGRSDAITGEMPDVDLSPDDALELGVSRRHACITFKEGMPYITDLGSTNRTFINRQVMMRGQPYPIKDGDEVRLGNAILKVIYRAGPS